MAANGDGPLTGGDRLAGGFRRDGWCALPDRWDAFAIPIVFIYTATVYWMFRGKVQIDEKAYE